MGPTTRDYNTWKAPGLARFGEGLPPGLVCDRLALMIDKRDALHRSLAFSGRGVSRRLSKGGDPNSRALHSRATSMMCSWAFPPVWAQGSLKSRSVGAEVFDVVRESRPMHPASGRMTSHSVVRSESRVCVTALALTHRCLARQLVPTLSSECSPARSLHQSR